MRRGAVYRIQRLFAIISFVLLAAIGLIVARLMNMGVDWSEFSVSEHVALPVPVPVINDRVAIISGHAGYDSGAICADDAGNTVLTEAEVNADIALRVAEMLRQDGTDVAILDEYDPMITNLEVDALVSLHVDSCIQASGYKAAYYLFSTIPEEDARRVGCIDMMYAAATGLMRHADTITHNMTEYHAFRKVAPTTPAAILELGFLGGDQGLLTNEANLVARGVAESIRCFLNGVEPTPTPIPTTDATADPITQP
jgi:N-acetylmuramoyl-L-alanine amidase